MKRLVLVIALLWFLKWRHDRFNEWDRQHHFGAHAAMKPVERS